MLQCFLLDRFGLFAEACLEVVAELLQRVDRAETRVHFRRHHGPKTVEIAAEEGLRALAAFGEHGIIGNERCGGEQEHGGEEEYADHCLVTM